MDRRIDIIGYLHIAYGVLLLLGAFVMLVFMVGGGILSGDIGAFVITSGVAAVVFVVMLILAAPGIIGGIGLLRRRAWGRTLVIVLSLIALFSFPIGTAIGGYSLWVLVRDEVRSEFR